ncbi:penicillin-binding protein 2 [Ideonella sp. 4Y16]|uniref:penicillin-binding protein 2 n=1 Tax=Ideonella alba TaxID=2824118 RepID=UPI001B390194|nr:penicillin-binding protein 2 [Ideonella alba]MBQ0943528.1 penicillin-binding protein 2 [Ideonella alba]
MTELRNLERELDRFRLRVFAAAAFVLIGFSLLVARLVYLQVLRHEELSTRAENNRIAVVPIVPNRGRIIDRNGVVLATNYTAYTLEITPSKVDDLEATINALAEFIDIQPRDRRRFKRQLDESKSFESLPIRNRLTDEELARFMAQRYRFPGVDVKARLFRNYPYGELASHLIGYIGRINQAEKQAMEDWDEETQANYRGTEYIGKLGLEQAYESQLHGTTGFEQIETSAGGRAVRRLDSLPATPGNTLVLSIDIKLQALIEELYGSRRGALVAIDPRNGEVLAFVSKPTFDPNLFVDGIDVENWRELNESIDKPLLNRALRGTYPPGSTYKPFMAIAALNSGKRSPSVIINDPGYFMFGGHRYGSPENERGGAMDMRRSIVESSNVYYYTLANEMGVDLIHDQLSPFGFGRRTGIDLEGEVTGILPSTEWKRRTYKRPEQRKWYAGETISLGIGQGYNSFTMLQMASAMATLASGGQRFEPRLVREVEDLVSRERRPVEKKTLEPLPLRPEQVQVVLQAMNGVTIGGTSARVFAGAPYQSGGKTGTAQAVGIRQNEKYSAARVAEHLRDHSLYVAFAPLEQPRIALALIVENAGWGAAAAAPIARRVFDYVLLGQYPNADDIAATQKGQSAAPMGPARSVDNVPLPTASNASLLVAGPAASAPPAPVSAASASPAGAASGGAR